MDGNASVLPRRMRAIDVQNLYGFTDSQWTDFGVSVLRISNIISALIVRLQRIAYDLTVSFLEHERKDWRKITHREKDKLLEDIRNEMVEFELDRPIDLPLLSWKMSRTFPHANDKLHGKSSGHAETNVVRSTAVDHAGTWNDYTLPPIRQLDLERQMAEGDANHRCVD